MAHIPTQESDIEKVIRIAKELDISIEDAAVTCDAFHLAFSDERLRREIFEIIDQLDREADKKGEPLGLIITYGVELGSDGIRVGRYADEIPPGQVVTLTPTNRARIFLRIKDNFPTQQFLGPMMVNRPEVFEFQNPDSKFESEIRDPKSEIEYDGVVCSDGDLNKLPSLAEEGWQPPWADGVVRSDKSKFQNPNSKIESVICLGPIRLTFAERFPVVSANASETVRIAPTSCFGPQHRKALTRPIVASESHRGQLTSGLSPPVNAENLGHSKRQKMSFRLPSLAKEGWQPLWADGVV